MSRLRGIMPGEMTTTTEPVRASRRILFLNAGGEWYGSDKCLYYVIRLLARRHECLAVLPFGEILDRKLTDAGVKCVVQHYAVLRRRYFTPWGTLFWLADFLVSTARLGWLVARYKPDIVFSCSVSVLEGAILSRLFRKRHVWHMMDILERPLVVSAVLRWCARRLADDTICVSHATASHIGLGPTVKTVHNGIPPVIPEPAFERKRGDEVFIVGVVGRFNAHKGQLSLLQAVEYLRRVWGVGDSLRVLLVGGVFGRNEKWRDQVKRFVAEHGLERIVELREFTEQIELIYPQLDLFVLPTIQPDPFPLVVLEAMSCGIPVVAYRSGGVEEMLGHDSDCLVALRDHEALGRAILRLMENEALRRERAQQHYERFQSLFTLDRFEQTFLQALRLDDSMKV